jgi:hypothetical protein
MSTPGVLHWLILILIIGTPIYIIVKAVVDRAALLHNV